MFDKDNFNINIKWLVGFCATSQ